MSNLYFSVSIVFPLFCMMALGYFLKTVNILNDVFVKQLNTLCFKVFLPILIFLNIYQSNFAELFSAKLVGLTIALVVSSFIILNIVIPKIEPQNHNRGVMIQGIFRSNYVLFGLPIAQGLYGGENTGTTAILIAFVVPLFNLLSVFALSTYSDKKLTKSQVFTEIIRNPLIIASLFAFCFTLLNLQLPNMVESTLSDIAKVATPLALIALGGSFRFRSVGEYKKQLFISVIAKLVVLPAIFISIAVLFGHRNIELAALMAIFASPTAVSTFTMAQTAAANDKLAGQIVVFTSFFAVFTTFMWVVILRYAQLI